MNKLNWNILKFFILYILLFGTVVFAWNNIYFSNYILELCSLELTNKSTTYQYMEIGVLYKKQYDKLNINFFQSFDDWNILNNPSRHFLYYGEWLTIELVDCFISYNDDDSKKDNLRIPFKLLIIYQDIEKAQLYENKVFPVLKHLKEFQLNLIPPYRKWYCQLSNSTKDVNNMISIFNDLKKIRKTLFIRSLDKKIAQVLFIESDPLTQYYNYSNIFSEKNINESINKKPIIDPVIGRKKLIDEFEVKRTNTNIIDSVIAQYGRKKWK